MNDHDNTDGVKPMEEGIQAKLAKIDKQEKKSYFCGLSDNYRLTIQGSICTYVVKAKNR